jgi:hypothetical protein
MGTAVLDEAAATTIAIDKEAVAKRAAEEAAVKAAADEEVAGKAADEAARTVRDSPAPGQAPSVAGAKRAAAPSGSTPPGVFGNLGLSSFLSFFFTAGHHSLITYFLPSSSPSGAATAAGTTASAAYATVGATPGSAPDGEPWTPEGVPEDVTEESEEEPEVASEPVPEVVWEEAPVEGAMIAVRTAAAPPPPRDARAPLLLAPRTTAASGVATDAGMEVVLGHPTPYAPGDISVGEAVSTAHQALSQAQRVLHREGEDLADECRRLQLWAGMLKRTTVSERAVAWAR